MLYIPDLLKGRLVYGCGIACVMHRGPTYIAEMSPSEIRGVLVSLNEAVVVLGILMGYTVGYLFSLLSFGWLYVYGCSMPVEMAMRILSLLNSAQLPLAHATRTRNGCFGGVALIGTTMS